MRGIVLAGGTGTRLWPITKATSKQLLPVYNKPLVFYPISTLMMAGINEILIITTPQDQESFKKCLGDGSQFNVRFTYAKQSQPRGLAEAFIIGNDFIGSESVALILGDNIFHGPGMGRDLRQNTIVEGAAIFACHVTNPSEYGVVSLNDSGLPVSIEEKPTVPKSNLAVPGLYFFDNKVVEKANKVEKSSRGELEITSLIEDYLDNGQLKVQIFPRSTTWFDAGTFESLLEASQYVKIIEKRQGQMIANLEEISWRNGWISDSDFLKCNFTSQGAEYLKYKESLITDREF